MVFGEAGGRQHRLWKKSLGDPGDGFYGGGHAEFTHTLVSALVSARETEAGWWVLFMSVSRL